VAGWVLQESLSYGPSCLRYIFCSNFELPKRKKDGKVGKTHRVVSGQALPQVVIWREGCHKFADRCLECHPRGDFPKVP
jgi:hypothetical protein